MIGLLTALLLAPSSGILVVDGLGIGTSDQGKWKAMDSLYSKSWPKQTIPTSLVNKLTAEGCYVLGRDFSVRESVGKLNFSGDDEGPGDRGWILADRQDNSVIWLGKKPTAPKAIVASNSSATYVKVVKDFLKTKGFKNANPVLQEVILADLDGNGSQEALIFASSQSDSTIDSALRCLESGPKSSDYNLVIVRYLSGKSLKVATMHYADARKGGLEGIMTFAGLWDLDGTKGQEIIVRWRGYEAWSSSIWKFANGKVTNLAEAGDGV